MFKLLEKDKCKSLNLDVADVGITSIVPGSILYDDADGVRLAKTGDDLVEATAGRFYIAMDHYHNSGIATYGNQTTPYAAPAIDSSKLAGVPVLEYYDMEYDLTIDLSKGDLVSIVNGVIVLATAGLLAFGMVSDDNNYNDDDMPVPTKITTWIQRHVIALP
ncbi:MAG: hypothetical protein Q8M92_01740 [Candidatus Subteraquimicrobiales bacterium]|nr:hypothetical protein [Candidatus Subteraquimicrobiales bacterium]